MRWHRLRWEFIGLGVILLLLLVDVLVEWLVL